MRVHILYNIVDGPYGGGNQFIRGLKKCLIDKGCYSEATDADVILFNSFPAGFESRVLKMLAAFRSQGKAIIHRVDGPISLYRGKNRYIDKAVFLLNDCFADATIFQSKWSREENYKLGMKNKKYEEVICNAPDPVYFNKMGKKPFSTNRKIRLIATSWSHNWNKGFDIYRWIDRHLDFSRYEMTFVGNSPVSFQNIHHLKPLRSEDLAHELKQHDVYVTASKKDPCSNSLLEALGCSLPVIAYRDGGHPEIMGKGGELFVNPSEIPRLLNKIETNYDQYRRNIYHTSMYAVCEKYYEFMRYVHEAKNKEAMNGNRLGMLSHLTVKAKIYYWRQVGKIAR